MTDYSADYDADYIQWIMVQIVVDHGADYDRL